jgi:hypothetical protein
MISCLSSLALGLLLGACVVLFFVALALGTKVDNEQG